ncbi:MAG: hypothetical protein AAF541_06935 [Pseudomonadota bacterium]
MNSHALAVTLWALSTAVFADVLWQTNANGEDIHLINLETKAIETVLEVGPNPHGLAASPDGKIAYVTLERDGEEAGELLWINVTSRQILHRLTIGPEPHQLAISHDGRWAYIPCRDGSYWVVDTQSRTVHTRINTGGRPHNTTADTDGHYIYLSPMGPSAEVTVVSIDDDHSVTGTIQFSDSVRPPALSLDGRYLFQHVDGLNGFEVAETKARKTIARMKHSTSLGWLLLRPKLLGWFSFEGLKRCHGLAIRPTVEEVWSVCGNFLVVHASTPPFAELRSTVLPSKGYWLTFDDAGKTGFIALSDSNQVAFVDASSLDLTHLVSVGTTPKRNAVFP